ncbi:periplasmic solute binding protein [Intrasporangium calvum DSM 43043]|uniref:Periplasmic solute binding protein n=2 Tax=Intrasporangium calvum TaxID=53358 RepID=E6SDH9_INTC7|nr:periplasmic solute binding protein [Intrasporangium calvum DSM 43043]
MILISRMILSMTRRLAALTAAAVLTLTASACSSDAPLRGTSGGAAGAPSVVTSFYPIQFATERIAGEGADVSVLTKPGAEPHDLEIGAQDLARLTDASLVIYSKGFQPAVDDAVEQVDPTRALDVSGAARLTVTAAAEEQHAGGSTDPHFWLDPERYADVARAIGTRLAELDPQRAATYERNTTAFVTELTALDEEFAATLRSCSIKELVTSHAAFTYLADRYGFEQHGITGVSPEAEPSAAGLAEITQLVRDHGVTTIYQETLVEPHFAETVAASSGATVATLDPLEGITDASAGTDYFAVMRSNLATLKHGQGCA